MVREAGGEVTAVRPSGAKKVRVGPRGRHRIEGPHAHPAYRNELPDGTVRTGISGDANPVTPRDAVEVYRSISEGTARTRGGR